MRLRVSVSHSLPGHESGGTVEVAAGTTVIYLGADADVMLPRGFFEVTPLDGEHAGRCQRLVWWTGWPNGASEDELFQQMLEVI
jgi:hypothetical protein